MANGYSGDYAVKLPSIFLQPGQAMQQAISVNERQKEAEREEARYRQQQLREDDSRKAAMLERNSDPLKYYTGVQMFDQWADNKTMEILDRFTNDPKYRNMDFTTFTGELNKAWLPIVQGHKLVKGKLNQELESVNQITKQNPWLDKDLLTRGLYGEIAKSFFQPNQQGEIDFVPTDRVNAERSITGELLSGDNAINYISNQAVDEFMKTFGKLPGESEPFVLKTPGGWRNTYKGTRNPFQVFKGEKDEYGFVKSEPKYEIATEGRTDEMGNPIPTVSQELMDTFVTNTTGNKMVYEKLFREYAQESGIDLSKLTPNQLAVERGKFNYTLVKNSPLNQPDLVSAVAPSQGSTFNINNAQPAVQDIYTPIKIAAEEAYAASQTTYEENGKTLRPIDYVPMNTLIGGASKTILDYANSITTARDRINPTTKVPLTIENTLIKLDENKVPSLYVIKKFGRKEDYMNNKGIEKVMTLDVFDINSKVNPTDKQRQQIIRQASSNKNTGGQSQPKPKQKTLAERMREAAKQK